MEKRQRKSFLAVLLALFLAFSIAGFAELFAGFNVAADEESASKWDGDLIAAGWGESGKVTPSEDDYKVTYVEGNEGKVQTVEIGTAAAFAYFAHEVYVDTAHNLDGATVKLTTDIDLQNHMWIPIGQTDEPSAVPAIRFSGTFDGQKHKITGLSTGDIFDKIKKEDSSYYVEYGENKIPFVGSGTAFNYGLFGVTYNLTVKNLTVDDVDIKVIDKENGLLMKSVGAIVGYNVGSLTMENCVAGSSETEDKIYVKGYDTETIESVGGLVGRSWAYSETQSIDNACDISLSNCKNYVDIDFVNAEGVPAFSNFAKIGGLIGHQTFFINSTIDSCDNYGNIKGGQHVGGFTSFWSNTFKTDIKFDILNCNNYGNIFAAGDNAGGFLGNMQNAIGEGGTFTLNIKNSNNYGNIAGKTRVGGIIGQQIQASERVTANLINNYNYGGIYGLGTNSAVGGYIGTLSAPYINNKNSSSVALNATISGGGLGTVYRTGSTSGSLFGSVATWFADKINCVDVGSVVAATVTQIDDVPTEHSPYVRPVYKNASPSSDGFIYSGAGTIVGLNGDTAVKDGTLTIPRTAETIGFAAFAGHDEIKTIAFQGNKIKKIEDFAFAGTGITSIELPEAIETIGNAAFGGIASLNYVTLPANATDISLGERAFTGTRENNASVAQGAYLIAAGNNQYKLLAANSGLAACGGVLTYKVTIKYFVNNQQEGLPEERLYGQDYKVTFNDGKWALNDNILTVGPGTYNWYNSSYEGVIAQISDITKLLSLLEDETIELHAYIQSEGGSKVFVPRVGIVYDANKTYTVNELNPLLYTTSDFITGNMTVTIEKYVPFVTGGEEGTPTVIHNAGVYTIKVVDHGDSDATYEFDITIERATLDLSDIANLQWYVTQIGENSANIELTTETLYIYEYSSGNGVYPSTEPLTATQISNLGLKNGYTREIVQYSVVRNRNAEITIELVSDAYTATFTTNTGTTVGKYTAQATLKTVNYSFTVGNISSLRGMTITLTNDNTATVKKDWYIVDISNWLTNGSGEDYALTGLTFGSVSVSAPVPYYGGTSAEMTMTLSIYDNSSASYVNVGQANTSISNFSQYINSVMPAGNYRLVITVGGVTTTETDGSETYHNGFVETIDFTVEKAMLPDLTEIHSLLKDGEGFSIEIASEGDNTLYDETTDAAIKAWLSSLSIDLSGTIWQDTNYYSTSYIIEFNLLRAQSDEYSETVDTSKPDTYTVYYRISALNYYSSIENLEGETRFDYKFTLVKIQPMNAPEFNASDLKYTGSKVQPAIADNALYEINWNDSEYVSGGEHTVSFTLYDSVHYRWIESEGVEVDGDTVTVTYTVAKATNGFTVSLNMLGWSYKNYGEANNIRAILIFGKAADIHFSVIKEGESTAVNRLGNFTINENGAVDESIASLLRGLAAGRYTLRASVEGTVNYEGFTDEVGFEISKAINAWSDGDKDLKLPNWVVGKYDAKENPIVVNAAHGDVNIIITDIDGKEYYNSVTGLNKLNDCEVGKYLLKAWVDETDNYAALAERTFTIEVFKAPGLPWWATLLIAVGALMLAALVIFILWKKGVFQILTEKLFVAIHTRASVEATIASVRAAKMMEEGRQSVAEAKRRERIEEMRRRAQEERELSPEERAARLEAKAQADAEKAEKLRKRSESAQRRADRMRSQSGNTEEGADETPNPETPTEE
ncbi:MAG: leucine-rich repeat protein [Clostridiales bacterium]|nr:leucine-rich repeat protein [Clostridiales bacterium]